MSRLSCERLHGETDCDLCGETIKASAPRYEKGDTEIWCDACERVCAPQPAEAA